MKMVTVSDDLARLRGEDPGRRWARGQDKGSLVVLFTPRSGSTWLGKLLEETGVLGFPEEYLNPAMIADANRDISAAGEYDFMCGCAASRTTENGFFSIQATWGEIERLEAVDFFEFFKNAKFVWLRRQDVVDEAISLLVATETGQFHRRSAAMDAKVTAEMVLNSLAPEEIGSKLINWIAHIVSYEAMTEIQIVTRNIAPYRLFYEDLEKSPAFHVAEIKQLCGVEDERKKQVDAVLKNVQTGRDELRDLFIKSHRASLRALEAIRPPLVY
jgi:LPS sulfotransferase NodH